MFDRAGEVIRVGASGARIVRVTRERIEYIDMAGQNRVIDLPECARNWAQWCKDHREDFIPLGGATQEEMEAWDARCVGRRGGTHRPWWVQLMDVRNTRFEFETWEASLKELWGPLMVAGWHTFDNE